jgi:ribosome-binding protein aMBF1 (putative translation factor)
VIPGAAAFCRIALREILIRAPEVAVFFEKMGQESGKRPKFDPEAKAPPKSPEAVQDEHQAFNTVVGEAIRAARQEHGWTQAFLADQAGLSPNYIARLERGELGPSLFVANRICDALGISLDELVGTSTGASGRKTTTRRRTIG